MIPRTGHAQTPSPGVFSDIQSTLVPRTGPALESATIRSRVARVDTQRIAAARQGREVLSLNLFEDAAVSVRIDRVRPTRSGYFIAGRPEGMEWGEVRLVVNGPVMVGTVVTPEAKFTIRWGGSGRHIIRQIDPAAELAGDDVVETPLPASPPQAIAPDNPLGAIVRPATDTVQDQPTEDGSEIRVLVVYTPALQAEHGGTAGVQALIDLFIQSANHAFETSGINPRLVLAHSALVNYVDERAQTAFDRLRRPDDGYMDEVHALRNAHAADLVHLVTRHVSGSVAGVAGQLGAETLTDDDAAFAVTADSVYDDSEDTFTHETGHNFGLHHDRFVDFEKNSIYPYAFGYVNKRAFEPGAPRTAGWRTIMAYRDRCGVANISCGSLFRFSNPDQTWLGDPLGVPADDPATGILGPADARLAINRAARWVGSFRSEACTDFTVSPETQVAPLDGGEVFFEVSTAPGCLWGASSQSGFLAPVFDVRHSGSGFVSVDVEANPTDAERLGTLSVAGTTVEVRQLATDAGICGRTPAVVRAISETLPCDAIADQHLSQITSLVLEEQRLTTLKPGDFEGLSNLEELSLNRNRFTELPEGVFSGLSSLRGLSLDDNQLTELPVGLFAGLSKLTQLQLRSNALGTLPEDVFAELSELQVLMLDVNEFSEFAAGTFRGLPNLTWLDLSHNPLGTLPKGLSELSNLRILSLVRVGLTSLPEGVFAGLPNLTELYLDGNRLAQIPPGVFRNLSGLQNLYIGANELTTLPEDVFSGLTALQKLGLYRNRLNSLPSDIFAGLSALKELYLMDNRLRSLPNGIFSGLTTLEEFRVERNRVDPLPIGLTLERVGDNQFKAVVRTGAPFELSVPVTSNGGTIEGNASTVTIPAGAVESSPISVARIADMQQRVAVDVDMPPDLPASHSGYVLTKDEALPLLVLSSTDPADTTLSGLSLSDGTLDPVFAPDTTVYKASIDHVVSSTTVTLVTSNASAVAAFRDESDAALPDADANTDGHQVSLDEGENDIKVVVTSDNGTSTQTYTIVVTRLGSNCNRTAEVLGAIMEAVSDIESCDYLRNAHLAEITLLHLYAQGISSLKAGDFAGLSSLEELLLTSNDLERLPDDVFSGLSSLRMLVLAFNELTDLPENVFSGLSALRILRLSINELTELPENVFSGLSALQQLWLDENRLTELPDGLFFGLTGLQDLRLNDNAVNPLPIPISLEKVDENRFKAVAPTGAPFTLELPLSVSSGGEIEGGANSITITIGAAESVSLGVTRVDAEIDSVTIDIATLPFLPVYHRGYFLDKDATLPIEIPLPDMAPPPAQVAGVEVTPGIELLEVSWTAVPGADGYKVQWKSSEEDYDETRQAVVSGADAVSYTITGLTVGTKYNVRVIATRANADDGPPSEEVTGIPEAAPLAQVMGLEIRARMNQLRVSWTAVADADGYKLQWTSGEENYDEARQVVVAGADTLSYTITGLSAGTEHTVRVIATGELVDDGPPSEEITATPRSADPDVNGDGVLGTHDAQVMLYAFQYESLVGDGETGGTAELRQRFLAGYSGRTDPSDADLQAMLRRANAWREAGVSEGGDINDDGVINGSDAYAMYYAYAFESLLGNGDEGGTARFRSQLLGPLAGTADPTDEDLKDMLRRANKLRDEFN